VRLFFEEELQVRTQAVVALVVMAFLGGWILGRTSDTSPASSAGYRAPRTAFGHPDLQGVWQVRNTANWDLEDHAGAFNLPAGFGVVVDPPDGVIPYQPAALDTRRSNSAAREDADPVQKCYLAGVPRTMYLPHPLQIFQTDEEVVILSEYVHTTRWIPLISLERYAGYESWMGDSRGRWEGETLVIETTGFNGETWFDHSGNFHTDGLTVTERLTRTAPDVITYEATIEDANVFTRPWTIRMPIHRHTDREQILEYECYLYAGDEGRRVLGSHPEFP
jgi:hypothetical protein